MDSKERKKYIFAQLNSLPNTFQYMEVKDYIESLQQENKHLKDLQKSMDMQYAILEEKYKILDEINQELRLKISSIGTKDVNNDSNV